MRPPLSCLARVVAVVALLGAVPVRADSMDPALSRLRIVGGQPGCQHALDPGAFCPDNELFERLVSELAVTIAPPISLTARSAGPRGFYLGIDSTVTTIEADQRYWVRGTEGDAASAAELVNDSPSGAMVWNRLEVRKGMPLGLEVAGSVAQGVRTSLWALSASLRWSLVEGFRTGTGRLPDVALRGTVTKSFGSDQIFIDVYAFDLILSKPFVLDGAWEVSPLLGAQVLVTDASSGVVDLTPGGASVSPGVPPPEDALGTCMPVPGHDTGAEPATVSCTGEASDLVNDVTFTPLTQARGRLFVGARLRYHLVSFGTSLAFDVSAPEVEAEPLRHLGSQNVARQVAVNFSLGVEL